VLALALGPMAGAQAQSSSQPNRGGGPDLKSSAVLVVEQETGRVVYEKMSDAVVPIASITKVMTALVVLETGLRLSDPIVITREDVDQIKHTRSRLRLGTMLTREDLLKLALMASENRAAAALSRVYPGGPAAFVAEMNRQARALGMQSTRFVDGTGLSSENVSTARDLARLVGAAHQHELIREYTTDSAHTVRLADGRTLQYANSNRMVRSAGWDIGLSKTGYINEAGRCLVLQATIAAKPVVIVLLDSWGRLTRIGDANRIKRWMEHNAVLRTAG
jgi:serine-type D-Ala-D-Ala endopeptidase (penicillin-binding protein 7)